MTWSLQTFSKNVRLAAMVSPDGLVIGRVGPRALRLVRCPVGSDLLAPAQRQLDLVDPGEQHLAQQCRRAKMENGAVRCGHRLAFQVDDDAGETAGALRLVGKMPDLLDRELDRKKAVAEGVIEEDAAEARRNDRAKAELAQRPWRRFARGAAAEVAVREKDLRVLPRFL